ncbi:hypothetical protein PVAND_000669 [Polypedilum vanderplanki]|uniref:Uncharacterized protein n=1 Tax=Polypedilum vanderplanki TaxID=319348 RepID=A0A9J6BKJ9_POLVA|nr:hypothetical protein PVAND_000669 [Polypedilum vanderplanki]
MALENVRVEDFIEYYLFPELDGVLEENEVEALNVICQKINEIAQSYTSNYIWHKDPFILKTRNGSSHLLNIDNNEQLPPHLYGISHYGDNIQDEWFIVSLLFYISRELPSIIIRVCDSDGEFLLIEAAEHLPRWANPDTCEQKVFIHNGHLLLIHDESDKSDDILPIQKAIQRISENPTKYIVTKDIETCVFDRIKEFPKSIEQNLHRQTVYVPLGVAALLRHNPQLISPAVLAFCNRDPIDMKACRAMRYFPPENRVYTSVQFTKCLYAMIVHSNYLPDRRTGWNIPLSTSPHYKAHLLGVKIACGFEILAAQAKSSTANNDVSIEMDREWQKYVDSLKDKNYFQNELEGSKKYQELMKQAKDFYIENRDTMKTTHKIGDDILKDLRELDINLDEFKKLEKSLPDSDNDNWLNISPDELDDMLARRYGIKNLLTKDMNENSGQLTGMLNEFLNRESEFDGVDLNENLTSFGQQIANTTEASIHLASGSGTKKSMKVDFDPDAFCSTVQNLLDLVIPEDNWDSQSDMSDYENDDDLLAKNIDEISKNRHVKGRKKKQHQQNENEKKSDIAVYMEQMDRELASTTIGKSFVKQQQREEKTLDCDDGFDDIEDFTPVDVDMNAVKNMMESYKMQGSSAGPTTNLLSTIMGNASGSKKQTDV